MKYCPYSCQGVLRKSTRNLRIAAEKYLELRQEVRSCKLLSGQQGASLFALHMNCYVDVNKEGAVFSNVTIVREMLNA
jgi:hypothetical protein